MILRRLLFAIVVLYLVHPAAYGQVIATDAASAPHRGVYELRFVANELPGNPFFDHAASITFTRPDDALVGRDPLRFKCARDDDTILVYMANPSGDDPETDNPGVKKPTLVIDLPEGTWSVRWFKPRTGERSRRQVPDGK